MLDYNDGTTQHLVANYPEVPETGDGESVREEGGYTPITSNRTSSPHSDDLKGTGAEGSEDTRDEGGLYPITSDRCTSGRPDSSSAERPRSPGLTTARRTWPMDVASHVQN